MQNFKLKSSLESIKGSAQTSDQHLDQIQLVAQTEYVFRFPKTTEDNTRLKARVSTNSEIKTYIADEVKKVLASS